MLPFDCFLRVYKQFIVNLDFIEKIPHSMGADILLFIRDEEDNTI